MVSLLPSGHLFVQYVNMEVLFYGGLYYAPAEVGFSVAGSEEDVSSYIFTIVISLEGQCHQLAM